MALAKQQKPANEACPQEEHKFWGSKVFGGNKQNPDQQSNGRWFGRHKQDQQQHCRTCQCATSGKKEHTIGVTIQEEKIITSKNDKVVLKNSAKNEVKVEEKAHGGKVIHGKDHDNGSGGMGKKKDQTERHRFRSMGGHVRQRFAMMKNNHEAKSSDSSSSSSDSDDERIEKKKKKEKGQSHGVKITSK